MSHEIRTPFKTVFIGMRSLAIPLIERDDLSPSVYPSQAMPRTLNHIANGHINFLKLEEKSCKLKHPFETACPY